MALRPRYQKVSERRMIRSTAGVIINVRRDHLEQLGRTLPTIARSLSRTMPGRPISPLLPNETRFAVRLDFVEPRPEQILPGMTAKVDIDVGAASAMPDGP